MTIQFIEHLNTLSRPCIDVKRHTTIPKGKERVDHWVLEGMIVQYKLYDWRWEAWPSTWLSAEDNKILLRKIRELNRPPL